MGHRLALLLLVACGTTKNYIFDDDLASPDGQMALIYLLRDPEARVVGVSCSFGKGPLEDCMRRAAATLSAAGYPEVPVVRGAEDRDDLGKRTQAVQFILQEAATGDVTLITAGPLTNLASSLQQGAKMKIAVVATDVEKDEDAADVVFSNEQDMLVVAPQPLDAVVFDDEDMEALERAGSALSRYVRSLIDAPGFKPRTMTGLALATDEYFQSGIEYVAVNRKVEKSKGKKKNVVYGFNDVQHFKRRFRERLVR